MLALIALIVFFAYGAQAAVGFGGTMLALSLGGIFVPLPVLLPIVVPVSVALSLWILARDYRHVDVGLLVRAVLPFMIVGLVPGLWLGTELSADVLKLVLGVVVLLAAARGTALVLRESAPPEPRAPSKVWLCGAGLVHGMVATGGPALVYAIAGSRLSKSAFRATLAVVWILLNVTLSVRWIISGVLDWQEAQSIALVLPALLLSAVVGQRFHDRFEPRTFQLLVYGLLMLSGAVLVAFAVVDAV
jgi:uncharacterized membrane protein YfcA